MIESKWGHETEKRLEMLSVALLCSRLAGMVITETEARNGQIGVWQPEGAVDVKLCGSHGEFKIGRSFYSLPSCLYLQQLRVGLTEKNDISIMYLGLGISTYPPAVSDLCLRSAYLSMAFQGCTLGVCHMPRPEALRTHMLLPQRRK